ncbi:MAG: rRNA pseudouridine synthase [Bacteroidales bacterium]|nr:rRNA pseudouridine synthase [Bacteroidales bacterium]
MTEQGSTGKRPRTRRTVEHKEEFLQGKSFRISRRDGDEEGPRKERKFGDKPRGERRKFNDRDEERPRRRFNDRDEERPRRKFNDKEDERPRRKFQDRDEERPRRRFNDREDERPRRRFNDRDEERPRRRFNDRDEERPRRRSSDRREDRKEEAPRRGRKGYVREKDPLYDRPAASGEIRLNKYLADSGVCSRREADELIKAGCVTVNGEVVTTMGYKVKPTDKVVYGGQTLNREKLRYILLNKPKGYITTADDPEGRTTVMELVRDACTERIFPVGRLDKNTTGLLLLTNDGELAKRLTHPSSEVTKLYHVVLDKPLTRNDMLRIADGVELDDGLITPDEIAYDADDDSKKSVGIKLHSGRNRIVRRIFEHFGYDILKLDRVMFAGLDKYRLPRGEWRFLTDAEVAALKRL